MSVTLKNKLVGEANAIFLSAAALGKISAPAITTMKLKVQLQGQPMIFLVDSGSTHSFVDCTVASKLQGVVPMHVSMVKVANGSLVLCSQQLQKKAMVLCRT